MSKLSIYETGWINLVFQDRNKEYGAYQLRQEATKTSLRALFMGILLLASLFSLPTLISHFSPNNDVTAIIPDFSKTVVQLSDIVPNQILETQKQVLPEIKKQNPETAVESAQLVNPIITQASQADQDIAKNTDNTSVTNTITEGTGTVGINPTSTSGVGTETAIPIVDSGNTIVNSLSLDKLPEFPGGINKFYSYVGNNFEKQEIDGSGSIRVYVSFVIERDGSMTDIQVKKDPGYGLGKEAVRVLKSLKTKWSPGMIAGKPVRTAYNLPINVQMN
ncbi:ferric siderophore ABC transporter substrate-binding protein [Flavobacterium petrolei]|uniref:Ferric siderophore ABC transporter substrate-binding protein n=1 Tax=Flavobacterium petrolei TaxID=2259594 RepID=A0A482TV68_9FLAO|nr:MULTISPECIES: energy transducer TonB [Flavobacterium]QIH39609.1 ferric siderophore ABC transporter substrate-binding protein [Flavobacterium sp. Sr18]RYJ51802.1 ferric siderophore ABC transporter substrate-binding protein [Flavobacterium petrolei]